MIISIDEHANDYMINFFQCYPVEWLESSVLPSSPYSWYWQSLFCNVIIVIIIVTIVIIIIDAINVTIVTIVIIIINVTIVTIVIIIFNIINVTIVIIIINVTIFVIRWSFTPSTTEWPRSRGGVKRRGESIENWTTTTLSTNLRGKQTKIFVEWKEGVSQSHSWKKKAIAHSPIVWVPYWHGWMLRDGIVSTIFVDWEEGLCEWHEGWMTKLDEDENQKQTWGHGVKFELSASRRWNDLWDEPQKGSRSCQKLVYGVGCVTIINSFLNTVQWTLNSPSWLWWFNWLNFVCVRKPLYLRQLQASRDGPKVGKMATESVQFHLRSNAATTSTILWTQDGNEECSILRTYSIFDPTLLPRQQFCERTHQSPCLARSWGSFQKPV